MGYFLILKNKKHNKNRDILYLINAPPAQHKLENEQTEPENIQPQSDFIPPDPDFEISDDHLDYNDIVIPNLPHIDEIYPNTSHCDIMPSDGFVNSSGVTENDLILAFVVRHQLTDSAFNDLLTLMPLLGVTDYPKNSATFYNFVQSKSYFFCECLLMYAPKTFTCGSCKSKANNFFHVPDFISSCMRIIPQHFNSGQILQVTLYTDGISTFEKYK